MIMSSYFDSFIKSVDDCLGSDSREQVRVLTLRELLSDFLTQEDFVLSCLERVTDSIGPCPEVWNNPPLFSNVDLDYSIRMIYWPPNYSNNPHQHNSWTVTGVFHNKLKVTLYVLDNTTESGLSVEKSFVCGRGEVGYIYSPCIHSITNPSDIPSASLHIFSALLANAASEQGVEGNENKQTIWYPSPLKGEILKGVAQRALMAHIDILRHIHCPQSLTLLDRIFELGDLSVKIASIKALCGFDTEHAARKLSEVSMLYSEPMRSELIALSHRVLKSRED